MNDSRFVKPPRAYETIEDALADSILNVSVDEIREELAASGEDVGSYLQKIDSVIAQAQTAAKKSRLETARAELLNWRAKAHKPQNNRSELRARFERMKQDDPTLKMLAARKGEGFSESDIEGLLNDVDALLQLEKDKEK